MVRKEDAKRPQQPRGCGRLAAPHFMGKWVAISLDGPHKDYRSDRQSFKKNPTTHKNKTWGSKVIPSVDICPIRTNHGLLRTAGFGVPGNALNLL